MAGRAHRCFPQEVASGNGAYLEEVKRAPAASAILTKSSPGAFNEGSVHIAVDRLRGTREQC